MNFRQTIAAAGLLLASASSFAIPSAWFVLDGDTFTAQFKITNSSSASEQITSLSFVLPSGFVFDTASSDSSNLSRDFASVIRPYLLNPATSTLPSDNGTSLLLGFSAFDGRPDNEDTCGGDCQYSWTVDVDSVGGVSTNNDLSVLSNQLFGAQISVTFSEGTVLSGQLGICTASAAQLNRCTAGGIAAYWEGSGSATGGGTTPEPGSLALAGLALLALGAAHRARRG